MEQDGEIFIEGLQQMVSIGVTEEEKSFPQLLKMDVKLKVSCSEASQSDSLNDTVNYIEVIDRVEELCKSGRWNLLEKFSQDILLALFEISEKVRRVEMSVYKFVDPRVASIRFSLSMDSPRSG